MKNEKRIIKNSGRKFLFAALIVIFSAALFTACGGGQNVPQYPEREILTAEVGYDFILPAWITKGSKDITVTDAQGDALTVSGGVLYFDKTGDYTVNYKQNGKSLSVPLKAVDTQRPMFYPIFKVYHHQYSNNTVSSADEFITDVTKRTVGYYQIDAGIELCLDDIFIAYDNSGTVTLTFEVYHNGAIFAELDENNSFVPASGYYMVDARAVDTSGNVTIMRQKLTVAE